MRTRCKNDHINESTKESLNHSSFDALMPLVSLSSLYIWPSLLLASIGYGPTHVSCIGVDKHLLASRRVDQTLLLPFGAFGVHWWWHWSKEHLQVLGGGDQIWFGLPWSIGEVTLLVCLPFECAFAHKWTSDLVWGVCIPRALGVVSRVL